MARILPKKLVPGFVEAYGVTALDGECSMDQLMVKIWDKYGAKPDEGAETATGKFIGAIVICDDCSKGVELDRAKLEAVEK